jgi:hypothetical protein
MILVAESEPEVIWALTWKKRVRIMMRSNRFIEIATLYAVQVSVYNDNLKEPRKSSNLYKQKNGDF